MNDSTIFIGKTVGVNKWHGVNIRNKRIYVKPPYKIFVAEIREACKKMIDKFPTDAVVDLHLVFWMNDYKDTDGIIKPVIDGVKDSKVISDDRMVRDLNISRSWHIKAKESRDLVMIRVEYVCRWDERPRVDIDEFLKQLDKEESHGS